jgi:hypothetical protein
MAVDYLLGLDLGQACDRSVLVILERTLKAHRDRPDRPVSHYALRYLHCWPLRTSYTSVAADLAGLVRRPPLNWPVLVVDQTGVCQAVVDWLVRANLAAMPKPVVITGGRRSTQSSAGAWHVPKKELIGSLQLLLRSRRLQVAALPERATLLQELQAFCVKLTAAAHERFEARRPGDHDDVVMAIALAAWWGERTGAAPRR